MSRRQAPSESYRPSGECCVTKLHLRVCQQPFAWKIHFGYYLPVQMSKCVKAYGLYHFSVYAFGCCAPLWPTRFCDNPLLEAGITFAYMMNVSGLFWLCNVAIAGCLADEQLFLLPDDLLKWNSQLLYSKSAAFACNASWSRTFSQ